VVWSKQASFVCRGFRDQPAGTASSECGY